MDNIQISSKGVAALLEQRDALVAALHGVMAALDPNSLHQPDAQHAWALARLALLEVQS